MPVGIAGVLVASAFTADARPIPKAPARRLQPRGIDTELSLQHDFLSLLPPEVVRMIVKEFAELSPHFIVMGTISRSVRAAVNWLRASLCSYAIAHRKRWSDA